MSVLCLGKVNDLMSRLLHLARLAMIASLTVVREGQIDCRRRIGSERGVMGDFDRPGAAKNALVSPGSQTGLLRSSPKYEN